MKHTTERVCMFTYPDYGTPDGYPDHTAHSGQRVTIISECSAEDYDRENCGGDTLYQIRANDGWIGEAWGSELRAKASK